MIKLKELLIDTVEEMNHLERAKELLYNMYFEADRNMGVVSTKTLQKVHDFFRFDRGEDE